MIVKTGCGTDGSICGTTRDAAVQLCLDTKCDHLFVVDSDAHLDNQHTLMLLVEQVASN